jgi:hypothetical protein
VRVWAARSVPTSSVLQNRIGYLLKRPVLRLTFRDILVLIARLRAPPHQRERCRDRMREPTTAACAMTKAKQQVLCSTRRKPIDSTARGIHRGSGFLPWMPQHQTMALACPAIRGKTFPSVSYFTLLDRFLNDTA